MSWFKKKSVKHPRIIKLKVNRGADAVVYPKLANEILEQRRQRETLEGGQ